jgi:hypothetical protein
MSPDSHLGCDINRRVPLSQDITAKKRPASATEKHNSVGIRRSEQ